MMRSKFIGDEMKEVKIRSIITNSENETSNLETKGEYDVNEKTITYSEAELINTVYIFEDCVKIIRKNEDYNLNLEFRLNEKIKCNYEIKSVDLNVDLLVTTKKLEIEETYIYIDYELSSEDEIMGTFEYKLIFWE